MKEYPIRIMNLKDLIRFQKYVFSRKLHGQIRQKNYVSNVRSGLQLVMALPLDAATLCLKDSTTVNEDDLIRICRVTV